MPLIDRVRVSWTGFPGAPGVSTFYANSASVLAADLYPFLDALGAYLPQGTQLTTQTVGDTIDVATGELRSTWSSTAASPGPGYSASSYAGPAGAQVQWVSDSIVGGRKLVGKTFLVPLTPNAYELDGTLATTFITAIKAVATSLIAAHPGNFLVYRRPFAGTPSWTDVRGVTHPAKPAYGGYVAPVVGARVPDLSVVLRSRRD